VKLKQIRVDGYKNLIDCVVNLGDFNVIVGPNNSGKSNLLEAIQMLFCFCFGSEKSREMVFKGFPARRFGTSICHLVAHGNKNLSIGITFEINVGKDVWIVDYDFTVLRHTDEKGGAKFLTETLRAKQPSRRGAYKKYISRDSNKLKIVGKKGRNIADGISSLLAIKSLHPNFEGLPPEFKIFFIGITDIALTGVFVISPDRLRDSMGRGVGFEGFRISSFDLLLAIDEIWEDKEKYEIFKQSICDILDLEDLIFEAREIPTPSEGNGGEETIERIRRCYLKRRGDISAHIAEYSDGTLAVVATLSALFSKHFTGPILCLEELENCLHPAAVEKLLRFLQDHAEQWPVLLTTHSPYVLNGIKPEDLNVAIVGDTGATHFEKVKNSKQLRDYLNKGLMSFGELLVSDFKGFREGRA